MRRKFSKFLIEYQASGKNPLTELFFELPGRGAERVLAEPLQQGVELRTVVVVAQMAEFVEDDIVT